jgi:DnaJ-class molecular chaperone
MFRQRNNDDLYKILNLDSGCSKRDIKNSYKKLALLYHPDKLNTDASETDKQKFVEISRAYEVLYDDDKRDHYDRYGTMDDIFNPFENHAQSMQSMNSMPDLMNLFEFMFQGGEATHNIIERPPDIDITVDLSLLDIFNGAKKNITFKRNVLVEMSTNKTIKDITNIIFSCAKCHGLGKIQKISQTQFMIIQRQESCDKCNGTGYVNLYPDRFKLIDKQCKFDYKFCKGIKNHEKITLKGLGNVNLKNVGNDGNINIHVNYNLQDSTFKLDEHYNLIYYKQISVFESISGPEFIIKHPIDNLLISIEDSLHSGSKKIIKNYGIPQIQTNHIISMTDMIVIFNIIYPSVRLTDHEKKILKDNFSNYYKMINNDVAQKINININL